MLAWKESEVYLLLQIQRLCQKNPFKSRLAHIPQNHEEQLAHD